MTVAVAVAVSGGVAVPVAGLTKRFFNRKDFLINVWGYGGKIKILMTLKITIVTNASKLLV